MTDQVSHGADGNRSLPPVPPQSRGAQRPPPPTSSATRALWPWLVARAAVLDAWRPHLLELSRMSERSTELRLLVDELQSTAGLGRHSTAADVLERLSAVLRARLDAVVNSDSESSDVQHLCRNLREKLDDARPDEPFSAMLDRVCERARTLYGRRWRQPQHDYTHVLQHPRLAEINDDPYTIRAVCDVQMSPPSLDVIFYAPWLGPHAYATLPMLLVHECVSHVASSERTPCNESLFLEGLMDWASFFFFEQWASKIAPGMAAAARWHGRELQRLLIRDAKTNYARETAHMVAERLVDWAETALPDPMPHVEARRQVALLAVALNTVECDLRHKDLLVSALHLPLESALADAMRDWLANADRRPERLLEAAREERP